MILDILFTGLFGFVALLFLIGMVDTYDELQTNKVWRNFVGFAICSFAIYKIWR